MKAIIPFLALVLLSLFAYGAVKINNDYHESKHPRKGHEHASL